MNARERLALGAVGLLGAVLLVAFGRERERRRRYLELRAGFVAALSHELRTPLASMPLQLEALERTADRRMDARLARLLKDVDGLDLLIENVLSYSRLERGRLTPRL